MEPARTIIDKFGNPAEVARICGLPRQYVWRWTQPTSKAGCTGGRVPQKHIPKLLVAAAERGIDLRLEDFFPEITVGPDRAAPQAASCLPSSA